MHLELIVVDGPQAGRRISLSRMPVTFGRSSTVECSFPLDSFMSGRHLTIQNALSGIVLIDLQSSNGTFLNDERIRHAIAVPGDSIRIGTLTMKLAVGRSPVPEMDVAVPAANEATSMTTVFPVPGMPIPSPLSAPAAVPPPATLFAESPAVPSAEPLIPGPFQPTPEPVVEETAKPAATVLGTLLSSVQPLFALLDTGANVAIPGMLGAASDQRESLQGAAASTASVGTGPYLVKFDSDSRFLPSLVDEGWTRGWACFFTSAASFEDIRAHFGKFYRVQLDAGQVYFRFYDPVVLREFLPMASREELGVFFGPVEEWLLSAEDGVSVLQARFGTDGLRTQTVAVG